MVLNPFKVILIKIITGYECAPVSSSDELNKLLCETRYRKITNNNKLLEISNDGRWDAKDERMTGVAQAQ